MRESKTGLALDQSIELLISAIIFLSCSTQLEKRVDVASRIRTQANADKAQHYEHSMPQQASVNSPRDGDEIYFCSMGMFIIGIGAPATEIAHPNVVVR